MTLTGASLLMTRPHTSRVGTMLYELTQEGAAITGRMKPKTSADETSRLLRRVRPKLQQAAYPVRRPEEQEGFALYLLLWDGAEEARVAGVRAVIAHHEDVALGDGRRGR